MRYFIALCGIICILLGCDKTTKPTDENANQRPIITSSTSTTAIRDSLFRYLIAANEPNDDDVYFSLIDNPDWLSINGDSVSGIAPWEANNTFFMVSASDGELSDTLTVLVFVEENDAFYLGIRPRENNVDSGEPVSLTLGVNSVDDLFGISFDLVFDSTVVMLDSVFIPSSSILDPTKSIMFYDYILNGVSISASRLQTDMNDNVSGSGPLVMVHFQGFASGSTSVEIQNVMIIDETGEINPGLGNLVLKAANIHVY